MLLFVIQIYVDVLLEALFSFGIIESLDEHDVERYDSEVSVRQTNSNTVNRKAII